ncbi:hypothetical protein BD779DRAFT_1484235, partial [Infundibulicybe gibba]
VLIHEYGRRRDAGWIFLFMFSLVRITDGALIVAGELTLKADLFLAAYILHAAGLAPLMMSTLGFLGLVGQNTYSERPRVTLGLRIIALVILAALGVSIAGGLLGTHVSPTQGTTGWILRRAGSGIFGAAYILIFIAHGAAWSYRHHLRSYRRRLLSGMSLALPLLGVRTAYAILASWSSSDLFGTQLSKNPTLAKLNPITGQWLALLIMFFIMEYAVAAIYMLSSTVLSRRYH